MGAGFFNEVAAVVFLPDSDDLRCLDRLCRHGFQRAASPFI
jgi:hypothetical protein